jgi:methylase of polypeptide subunit release factors
MLMRISADLRRQEIWAEGNELVSILGRNRDESGMRIHQRPYSEKELVAEITDPILLTDINAISKMEPTKRDTVFALLQSYPRTVEYDGVSASVDPKKHLNVWGPSIDTLVFANAMRTSKGILAEDVESAIDIGCASGFLGKYLLHKCGNLRELHLTDLNPYAVECASENVQRLNNDQLVGAYVADGRKAGKQKFDRVLCSPPYVPRPKSINDNPYEGIELLHDIIVYGKNYLGENGMIVLTTSSLCQKITDEAIEKAKTEGRLESAEVIGRKHVPLKVNPILNNKEWMAYLLDSGLEKKSEMGYEFWQDISILRLSYT